MNFSVIITTLVLADFQLQPAFYVQFYEKKAITVKS